MHSHWETQSLFVHANPDTLEHLRKHVTYSGTASEYIASYAFELPRILNMLGWKHSHLTQHNGQWFLRRAHS